MDAPSTCLGVDALGNYFTARLYQHEMPVNWAKYVAAHLIKHCKLYASGYCGGPTRLIEISNDGAPVETTAPNVIAGLEAHFDAFDDAMRSLLPGFDPNASDITIQHRLTELQMAINRIRGLAVAVMGPAVGLTFRGHAPDVTITANNPSLPLRESETKKPEDQ